MQRSHHMCCTITASAVGTLVKCRTECAYAGAFVTQHEAAAIHTGPMSEPAPRRMATEWPTLAIIGVFLAMFVGALWLDTWAPWPVAVAAFAVLGGWHMSLQHEVVHGHPTRFGWLNDLLVQFPAVLWLPLAEYRETHLRHHRVELTVPDLDPESYFVTAEQWRRAGPVWRSALQVNRTLAGRLILWPAVNISRGVAGGLRDAITGRQMRRIWLTHGLWIALTLWLVVGVGGVTWWHFVLGFTYGGLSLTYLRSFAEHQPVDGASRSAVVRSNRFWGVMFLYNNLHHTHHAAPGAPWYRLPNLAEQLRSDKLAAAGAGWYRGYGELFRRFLFRPVIPVVHPSDT